MHASFEEYIIIFGGLKIMDHGMQLVICHLSNGLSIGNDSKEVLCYAIIENDNGIEEDFGYLIGMVGRSRFKLLPELDGQNLRGVVDSSMTGMT